MADDEVDLSAIGFMFDGASAKQTLHVTVAGIQIAIRTIGEHPGHLQSGQYLWPASQFLAEYLVQHWTELKTELRPNTVVELGAGCGLCGIVASTMPSGLTNILCVFAFT
jgi:predicted nicotinamide N-methyase